MYKEKMIIGEDLKKVSNKNIMLLELSGLAVVLTGKKLGDEQRDSLKEDSTATLATLIHNVAMCSRGFERYRLN